MRKNKIQHFLSNNHNIVSVLGLISYIFIIKFIGINDNFVHVLFISFVLKQLHGKK